MLRIDFCFIFIAILGNIHLCHAVDCTSTIYSQDLDVNQLAISQMTADDFAATTQEQMSNRLKEIFNETVVRISYSINKTDKVIHFAYTIVYACNETITIASADGTRKTIAINPKFNKTKVDDMVSCGELGIF